VEIGQPLAFADEIEKVAVVSGGGVGLMCS
jgi:hypothetical protein